MIKRKYFFSRITEEEIFEGNLHLGGEGTFECPDGFVLPFKGEQDDSVDEALVEFDFLDTWEGIEGFVSF